MQHDIDKIQELCETHRTGPKLLIIPSAAIRTQMLKTLGDYGVYPLNMSVKTVRELSYDLAEHYIRTSDLQKSSTFFPSRQNHPTTDT